MKFALLLVILVNLLRAFFGSEICQEDPLCRTIDHLHNRISSLEQPVWEKSVEGDSWSKCNDGICVCHHPKISGTVDCWGKFEDLERIPENLIIPINVEILDLGNNHIPHLHPHLLRDLLKLKEVNLFGMGLKYLPEYFFEGNPKIRILKIQDNMLKMLEPNAFKSLPSLEYLDISGNMFEGLADTIFMYNPKLKILNLSNNKLKVISPALLEELTNLEVLDLSQNRLRILDGQALKDLRSLNKLFMSRNILSSLPEDLFTMNAELKSLDLSMNDLSGLSPIQFKYVKNINYLFLAGNKFESLRDENGFPESLHHLDMSNNVLSVLRLSRSDYEWKYLDLSNNALEDYSLTSLSHLETLRLNLNMLKRISFEELPKRISELYLHRNLIESIKGERSFERLHSLTKLSIRENSWTCDCQLGEFINWLHQLEISYDDALCEAPANLFGESLNTTITLDC